MSKMPLLFVVDDDAAVRDALSTIFEMEQYRVQAFPDGMQFLAAMRTAMPDAVLLDVHMPGRSGMDILRELHGAHSALPVFIISGQGDIPMAVEAIKNGALDFIEKPFDADTIVEHVRGALEARAERDRHHGADALHFAGADALTPREREVLGRIVQGESNKLAGRSLGISPRTVEVHRARIMEKLQAKNTADLIRIVMS